MPNVKNAETKKIGEGGFGCVFHPSITCSGGVDKSKKGKEFVSKIQKQDENSKNEIEISNIIAKIPGYKLYFAPILEACDVGVSKINDNIISQCDAYEKYQHETDLSVFKLPYVDSSSLSDAVLKKNKKQIIANFFETYRHLLTSLEMLEKSGVVHFDIKSENIIYDNVKNIPIVIDFGLSFQTNSAKYGGTEELAQMVFYVFEPSYYLWPIEVHLANMLRHNFPDENQQPTTKELHDMCLTYVENCKGFEIFSENFKSRYAESAVGALKKYLSMDRKKMYKEILQFAKTWDNYALGIAHLRLLKHMFSSGFVYNEVIVKFSQLLLMNCHPDPTQRLTISKSIKRFEEVFYTDDSVNDFKVTIKNVANGDTIKNSINADNEHLNTIKL